MVSKDEKDTLFPAFNLTALAPLPVLGVNVHVALAPLPVNGNVYVGPLPPPPPEAAIVKVFALVLGVKVTLDPAINLISSSALPDAVAPSSLSIESLPLPAPVDDP